MSPDTAFRRWLDVLAEAAPRTLDRALRRGGVHADVFAEHTVQHRLTWRQEATPRALARPVQTTHRAVLNGASVHVVGRNRVGLVVAEGRTPAALTAAAVAAAQEAGSTPGAHARTPPMTPVGEITLPSDAPTVVAHAEKAALVQAAAEAALGLDDRVRRVEVTYLDRERRTAVATPDGRLCSRTAVLVGLRVDVTLAAGTGDVTAYAVSGSAEGLGYFVANPPEVLARRAVERARALAAAQAPPAGMMPVVLAAGWGGAWLHEAVGHLFEADVPAGSLPVPGKTAAPPTVTLVDDPTWPGGRGTYACDDEGTPAGRTLLIEDGVRRSFLTDRRTALRTGLPGTGNGRRQDYQHAPLPRMSNLVLLPGAADPAALPADVRDGLFVAAFGHGTVRPGRGFVLDVREGYRIERGRFTAPVVGARLVGNGPDVLRGLAGVGSDLRVDTARGLCQKAGQTVPVSVGMPTVLLHAMHVEVE